MGTNKLILSENELDNSSEEALAKDLLDANEEAKKEDK
jgi:hypothetical protein